MVIGVSEGFKKSLEINGIGYRANVQGQNLVLNLGYSHPINHKIPKTIQIEVDRNFIHVSGPDKRMVGQIAAEIRHYRPVEPYKGKGIRYVGEYVRKKVGKTGA
jgi:large subunit ribosomal protein L6